jgi:hypothetical protein
MPIRRVCALLSVLFALSLLAGSAARADDPKPAAYPFAAPVEGSYDAARVAAIDLAALPIMPDFADTAAQLQAIAQAGAKAGLNPRVFTKIGDCMTSSADFLQPLAGDAYDLATYLDLQAVIDHYRGIEIRDGFDSFANPSLSAASGFNTPAVLEPIWNDPAYCGAEESPLACELRISKASVAIVMFGTNDLLSVPPDLFDYYLRLVVVEIANQGTVPLLFSFPAQKSQPENSLLYNQIVAAVAADYGLPMINLWQAFTPLPDGGINPDEPTHMTLPASKNAASFTEADLVAGHNLHNLLTLQALQNLLVT